MNDLIKIETKVSKNDTLSLFLLRVSYNSINYLFKGLV